MAKNAWYYEENDEPAGPVSLRQLKKLVAAKKVLPDTWVYREGLADWRPASSFYDLFPPAEGLGAIGGFLLVMHLMAAFWAMMIFAETGYCLMALVVGFITYRILLKKRRQKQGVTENVWYFEEYDEPVGPISLKQLSELVAAGKVLPSTMVYKEGTTDWQPASCFGELFCSAYSDVPFYKSKLFWVLLILLPSAALWPLMFGREWYYKRMAWGTWLAQTVSVMAAWMVYLLSMVYWTGVLQNPLGGLIFSATTSPIMGEIPIVRSAVCHQFQTFVIGFKFEDFKLRTKPDPKVNPHHDRGL